jgi:putative restriction endonuclease
LSFLPAGASIVDGGRSTRELSAAEGWPVVLHLLRGNPLPTPTSDLWNSILSSAPRGRWIEIDGIYAAVEADIELQQDDYAPSGPDNEDPTWRRNVCNVLQRRKKSEILWGQRGRYFIPQTPGDVDELRSAERVLREQWWEEVQTDGGPEGLRPNHIREIGVYRGAQGIWVDKDRTAHLAEDGIGIAVSMLHTGSSFPDELDEDAPIYHYPNTDRPPARDDNEVQALKNAKAHQVPVFVIVRPTPSSTVRGLEFGWVEDWNDSTQEFLITLGGDAPPPTTTAIADDEPFDLVSDRPTTTTEQIARPGQARFRFEVFQRYSAKCALCDITLPKLLDAAHLRPVAKRGSDDPRNALVLCANHHRALDAGLITINPDTTTIASNNPQDPLASIGVLVDDLAHIPNPPHRAAFQWLWDQNHS